MSKRIIVAITGASGSILAKRMVEVLHDLNIDTHLLISDAGKQTMVHECGNIIDSLSSKAKVIHKNHEIGASIASGSFHHDGMIIIPCSIKTLSAVANSYSSDLTSRAADVTLKEGRPLTLVVRETPFHKGHLELMSKAADLGAIIFPPIPAYYTSSQTIEEQTDQFIGRVCQRMGISDTKHDTWQGLN
jgi:flavin prenyltransferase